MTAHKGNQFSESHGFAFRQETGFCGFTVFCGFWRDDFKGSRD
jgi:hypothetical protein